ncbi:ATP-dependent RNA helicase DHX36 [Elysia marginata]|uniref:RNA helicase n=1 Tax=Elysia marginata TaxID=1093978 RepID=A0AAV4HN98_9GAST|nr:ATP-dependent RNA helicase DHX36 [Elysia marginata]
MPRKDPFRTERGPKLTEDVCISEEVKIGINLALQRFRLDPSQQELAFPNSLSTTERAYVHRLCAQLGSLKTWSRGSGTSRYITVGKAEVTQSNEASKSCFSLAHSVSQINSVLTKYPVTAAERQLLTPATTRAVCTNDSKGKEAFGKLTSNVPQVPAKRGQSDLNHFRQNLPVYQMGSTIVSQINESKVILIAGETGSGKTTQVPQLVMDDCCENNRPCRILCTQPRRIAAISIAERVAQERGERIGQYVGYQIRLESKISPKTVLTFCTTGVLLRTLMGGDECLDQVTHVIVDEVHERDKFTDFLLLCLKEALQKHPNLHVILMSATLNMDLFSGYFGCPVICVPGNLYDVEEFFLEDILQWTKYKNKKMDKALAGKKTCKDQEDKLSEWCKERMTISDQTDCVLGSGTEEESDVTTSDNAELGEEREDLEPWIVEEMDRLLRDVWLTGKEDLFHQILYLISSENVSVDYVQSETGTTPLMTAAARGFSNVVEYLLNLGASASFKTTNQWTALDFAKKFEHEDIIGLLEAQTKTLSELVDEPVVKDEQDLISPEDREILTAYQQSFDDEKVDINLVLCLLHKIHSSGIQGAILVFLPGYDDIMNLKFLLADDKRFQGSGFIVYTLHSSLQHSDQRRVFKNAPNGVRKIILSTNIAETSVTINDVVYVVDCGKVKEKTFDALSSLTMLKSNWISKASALQRKGRAGRCQAGKCYHMFSRARYVHLQDYQTPEILRLPLQELCLHTKLLAPSAESIQDFLGKCPQAPPQLVICSALQNLKTIDALDAFEELTVLGQHLADLPVEPRLGKIILCSVVLKCLDPVLTIVCTLSFKDPFVLPSLPYEKRAVMTKKRNFAEETYSDHIVFLRTFQAWQKAKAENWERAFCEKNYVSSSTMEMLNGMRGQLLSQLKASGFLRAKGVCDIRDLNTNSDNWGLVKACLITGTYPNIIQRDAKKKVLFTCSESNVRFHNSSVLMPEPKASSRIPRNSVLKKEVKALPSNWLIYEEMSRSTNIAIARHCSVVTPEAIFLFAGHSKVTQDMITETLDEDSDSMDVATKLDNWLSFGFKNRVEAETAMLFRMKWHSLFLNRVKHPGQPCSQSEEAVLQAVIAVVSNAEQALGITIPVGIGQRPRNIESYLGGGCDDALHPQDGGYHQHQQNPFYQHQYHFNQQQQHPRHHHHHHQQHHHPHNYPHHQQHQQYFHHQQQMYRNNNNRGGYNFPYQRGGYHGYGKFGPNHGVGRGGNGGSRSSTPGSGDRQAAVSSPTPGANAPTTSGAAAKTKASAMAPEDCRYFIMRCTNQKMVDISDAKGIWATSINNEAKLNRAFQTANGVYLIFMVPGNANFQGYAKMTSSVGKTKSPDFPGSGLTGTFNVEWIKRAILPFSMTNSLLNPWNENKRVHSSKDGQELAPKVATELLQLWDTHHLRRPRSSGPGGPSKARRNNKRPGTGHQQQYQQPQQQQGAWSWRQQRSQPDKEKQAGKDSPPSRQTDSPSGSSRADSGSSNNSPTHQASAKSVEK